MNTGILQGTLQLANDAAWIARGDHAGRKAPCDDASRPDRSAAANTHARQDGYAAANPYVVADGDRISVPKPAARWARSSGWPAV